MYVYSNLRLTKRSNFDDKQAAILKRIEIYNKKTVPVLEKYKHKVVKVFFKTDFSRKQKLKVAKETRSSL